MAKLSEAKQHFIELLTAKYRSKMGTSTEEEFNRRWLGLCKFPAVTKATHLEKAITEYLKMLGHSASKVSTTGIYRDNTETYVNSMGQTRVKGSGTWTKGSARKGFSDVDAVVYGLSLKIEVKFSKGDSLSKEQKKFRDEVLGAGGFYILAKPFDQFYKDLNILLDLPQFQMMRKFSS